VAAKYVGGLQLGSFVRTAARKARILQRDINRLLIGSLEFFSLVLVYHYKIALIFKTI